MIEPQASATAERDITKVLALYCQLVDDGEFDRLGEVFSERGAFLMDDEGPHGLAPLIEHFRVIQSEERRGVHIISTPLITISDDQADARTDIAFFFKGSTGWRPSAIGRYHDHLVTTEAGWRIETRVFIAR